MKSTKRTILEKLPSSIPTSIVIVMGIGLITVIIVSLVFASQGYRCEVIDLSRPTTKLNVPK